MTGLLLLGFLAGCPSVPDEVEPVDLDGDGAPAEWDCDDQDPDINPWADEVCDGVDNDCDGEIDEVGQDTWYPDDDGDLYGDASSPIVGCTQPEGTVDNAKDCDDGDPWVNKGTFELCDNGVDDDCDGEIDESASCMVTVLRSDIQALALADKAAEPADLDMDGVDDLLVGTVSYTGGTSTEALLWYGPVTASQLDMQPDTLFKLNDGALTHGRNPEIPIPVLPPDVDRDYPMVVFPVSQKLSGGIHGALLLGQAPFEDELDLRTQSQAIIFGLEDGDGVGESVDGAGDVNGDGYEDLVIGTAGFDNAGRDDGRAWLFYGPFSGDIDFDEADATMDGWTEDGDGFFWVDGQNVGYHVVGGQDFDGDGLSDIAVAEPHVDYTETEKTNVEGDGSVSIWYGPLDGSLAAEDASWRLDAGEHRAWLMGSTLAAADLNHDGLGDLLVGVTYFSRSSNAIVIIYGGYGEARTLDDLASDRLEMNGGSEREAALWVIPDMDDDGTPDILVSHLSNNKGGIMTVLGPVSGTVMLPDEADRSVPVPAPSTREVIGAPAGDIDGDGVVEILARDPCFPEPWLVNGKTTCFGEVGVLSDFDFESR